MKLIKFDLPINGTKVRNLEELRDNLTDEILVLARSSQLERWLRTRQFPAQADAVVRAVEQERTDKVLFLALCKVLEVEVHPDDVKAIFDAPPAPGRFIPGARYFELYEELKNKLNFDISNIEDNKNKVLVNKKVSNIKFTYLCFGNLSDFQYLDHASGGRVVNVFLSNGSKVLKGSLIAEVMNRGSLQRISSPVNGYVEEVFFRIGDYVKVGGDLFSVVESKA